MEYYSIIKPYTGPIPQFSRSPTPEDSPVMTGPRRSDRKRKQPVAAAQNRSSSTQAPASERASSPIAEPSRKIRKIEPKRDTSTHQEEASVSEDASSPVAGPSRKRQEPMRDDSPHHGGASVSERARNPFSSPSDKRQKPMRDTPTHHESLIQGQGLVPGFLSGSLDNAGSVLGDTIPQGPFDVNANGSDVFAGMNYGMGAFALDPASRHLSLDPSSPGMMGSGAFAAQGSIIPGAHDLLPDLPLQSIEEHESIATGAGTNATNSAFPTPQQQQSLQFGMPNVQGRLPPGYTRAGAQARDEPYGVWYFNPHDKCRIPMGHRHDMDSGVYFSSEECVYQSLMAMKNTEGIGFLLGVAKTAELILNSQGRSHLDNAGPIYIDPSALMLQITQIVNNHLPLQLLDRETFRVPAVSDIQRLSERNSHLPAGHSFDPFHRRDVPYDMPGTSGTQGGGQGEGAAGSSWPSRQGSLHPGPGSS